MSATKYNQHAWILSLIYVSTYTEATGGIDITDQSTDAQKIQHVINAINSEALYPDNLRRYGSVQNCIANWLMGLPSVINIPFMNWEILELAREWGYNVSTPGREDKFLADYWPATAMAIIKAARKYKIKIGEAV